jgi:hypothetical protein
VGDGATLDAGGGGGHHGGSGGGGTAGRDSPCSGAGGSPLQELARRFAALGEELRSCQSQLADATSRAEKAEQAEKAANVLAATWRKDLAKANTDAAAKLDACKVPLTNAHLKNMNDNNK